jgi:SAM-dependent methyltransferase
VNPRHRQLCASENWAAQLGGEVLPWTLGAIEAPATLLEVGPGPGAATDVLRHAVGRVTALEFDPELAAGLRRRFADESAVTVVRGDAAALPFASGSFGGVAAFTMLHHLPGRAAQDRAFAEFARVLTPGGVLFGTDSLDSPGLRDLHAGDTLVPLDPYTLEARLHRAGFVDVELAVLAFAVRFTAHTRR